MAELIIVFREVLEATLIVGILYTFLKQTNQDESLAKLWQGVLVALVASFVGSYLSNNLLVDLQVKQENYLKVL